MAHDRPSAHLDPQWQGRGALTRMVYGHIVIPFIMKESAEVNTLQSISSLTQSIIQCASPVVQHHPRESSRGKIPPHSHQVYDFSYTYDPTENQEASVEMAMTYDILNEAFSVDTQVNVSMLIEFNLLNFIFEMQD